MVAKKNILLLKKLKKQVRILQRKEEKGKNQLRAALKKVRKLSKAYKIKLAGKVRMMKGKMSQAQASTYAKVANNIERQLVKGIQKKAKALVTAASKIEKKYATKLAKSVLKKSKKVRKVKKVGRSTKPLVKKAKKKKKIGLKRS